MWKFPSYIWVMNHLPGQPQRDNDHDSIETSLGCRAGSFFRLGAECYQNPWWDGWVNIGLCKSMVFLHGFSIPGGQVIGSHIFNKNNNNNYSTFLYFLPINHHKPASDG